MLRVYHSNSLDVLEALMEYIVEQERLDDPFEPEMVLVQSTGMAQWLQMTMLAHDEFAMLRHYLNDDTDKRKLFQLASRTADLYDQYLVYRAEWLIRWEAGELVDGLPEAQIWQAPLWKALVEHTGKLGQPKWHRANLYDRFISILENSAERPARLPSRVFICGISALPPVYLNALKALGKHADIHILFTNPCRHYWGDIQDPRWLSRLVTRQRKRLFEERAVPLFENAAQLFDEEGIQNLPNPLLASWGKLGRDYIYLLSDITSSGEGDVDAFADITPDSLLHNIQLDILDLENRAVAGITAEEFARSDKKRKLDPDDRSIAIHVCHSPQREVEILHDRLLAMLQDDPTLTPRDIVVMVADIDSYSPFIQAVFGSATGDRYLPYAISDRRARQSHPALQAFLSLLLRTFQH